MSKNDDADLSGAYALNALSAEERAAYEALLATSDSARVEATELADTAVMLGLAAAPKTPAAASRAKLLAAIAVTPQSAPQSSATPQNAPVVAAAPQNAGVGATPLPTSDTDHEILSPAEEEALRRWFGRPLRVVASIAAAAVLVSGGVLIGANLGTPPESAPVASAVAQLQRSNDVQQASASLNGGGTASLMWSGSLGKAAISVVGEATPAAGDVYQLWYIADGDIRSAGFLPQDCSDDAWQLLGGDMHAGDSVGVTLEPSGGSAQPTTDPIVVLASA
jgi:anti-sigma-K factor RskA